MMYGASLMPNLKILDASDQALSGQLSPVSVPSLEVLNLSNNSIQVWNSHTLEGRSMKAHLVCTLPLQLECHDSDAECASV